MTGLLNFREYADHAAIHVSSVSRAVRSGLIPTVDVSGKRMIDPVAADTARKARERPHGPGGSVEQRTSKQARWRARAGQGFDYGQLLLLGALTAHGPRLIAEAMRLAGAKDERDIAIAAGAMHEIAEAAACLLFDEHNQARVSDYRTLLPEALPPPLSPGASEVYASITDQDQPVEPAWAEELFDLLFPVFQTASLNR